MSRWFPSPSRLVVVAVGCWLAVAADGLSARDFFVDGPGPLARALDAVRPGDSVTLKNGEWRDTKLVITDGGESEKPVRVRAETPGGVKLTGASILAINAPFVTVEGLCFADGAIGKGAVIQFNSHHGTVSDTAIIDYNPASFETEYYWVFFSGDHNRVDRCYFKGKSNLQPLVGNAIEGSRHNTVSRSYFKNIPYVANANGREIIRVWGSGKIEERDDDGAYFTIEENLFDHADGEGTETISLKSNHNLVQRNTVIATRGGINIRRGNFNVVQDNIVLGRGVDGAHGLRMSGRDNVVRRNFISECDYGIRVACGEFIASALSASYAPDIKPNAKRTAQVRIPTYPQVKNLTLADNVTVGISGPDLEIGSSYKNHWPESQQVLLPEDGLIRGNRFVRPRAGVAVVVTTAEQKAPLDRFVFRPNRYEDNVLVGGGDVAAAAQTGFALREMPADWLLAREVAALTPLHLDEVGPAWVVALRRAGMFSAENVVPAVSAISPEPRKAKKNR